LLLAELLLTQLLKYSKQSNMAKIVCHSNSSLADGIDSFSVLYFYKKIC